MIQDPAFYRSSSSLSLRSKPAQPLAVPRGIVARGTMKRGLDDGPPLPLKRADTCGTCRQNPVRETISRKTGLKSKQRTCAGCHAASQKRYRVNTKKTKRVLRALKAFWPKIVFAFEDAAADHPAFVELAQALADLSSNSAKPA